MRGLNRIWLRRGTRATLVLLHGFGAESNGWRPLVNALGRLGLDRELGILAIDLPGHSFGGAIATALAARSDTPRLASLTLIAPAGLGEHCNGAFLRGLTEASERDTLARWLRELVGDPALIDEAFVATAQQQLSSREKRIVLRDRLAALTIPVRLVWGTADRIMPVEHADGLPGTIAQHRFPEVGHLPQLEAVEAVARIVTADVAR